MRDQTDGRYVAITDDRQEMHQQMTRLFRDTRPEAEAVLIDLLRKAPPWRKLQMVSQLNATVRTLAVSGLRQRYPQADAAEIRRRLADLLLGPELALKVYGPLPATGKEISQSDPTLSSDISSRE